MPRIDNKLILLLIWFKIYAAQFLRRYQPGMRKWCSVACRRESGTWLISSIIDSGDGGIWQHNFTTFTFYSSTLFSRISTNVCRVFRIHRTLTILIIIIITVFIHKNFFYAFAVAIVNSRFNLETFPRTSLNDSHEWAITLTRWSKMGSVKWLWIINGSPITISKPRRKFARVEKQS